MRKDLELCLEKAKICGFVAWYWSNWRILRRHLWKRWRPPGHLKFTQELKEKLVCSGCWKGL